MIPREAREGMPEPGMTSGKPPSGTAIAELRALRRRIMDANLKEIVIISGAASVYSKTLYQC